METQLAALTRAALADFARHGWHGDERVAPALSLWWGRPGETRKTPLFIADDFWWDRPTAVAVRDFANAAEKDATVVRAAIPPGWVFLGAVIVVEVWAVADDDGNDEEEPPPHSHPGRFNIRIALGIGRDQQRYALAQIQGEPVEDASDELTGDVQVELARFVGILDSIYDEEEPS